MLYLPFEYLLHTLQTCRRHLNLSLFKALVFSSTAIITVDETAAHDGTNSTEGLVNMQTDECAARGDTSVSNSETTINLINQGFLTLCTLPEYITHLTVDFFEVGRPRNIFSIPQVFS